MSLPWMLHDTPFPPVDAAWGPNSDAPGLLAAGADLSVPRLVEAYSQGIFPWFSSGQPILWWSIDPRMVLGVRDFRIHASFAKVLRRFARNAHCDIRVDESFPMVMRHCANAPRKGQNGTWIGPEMQQAYTQLHTMGYAHSIETWQDGQLVGGLYCVAIGRAVFGESMFALQTDASKIALAALVAICRIHDAPWIDCQQNTRHLASMGAKEMPRREFLAGISESLLGPPMDWNWKNLYWDALGLRPQSAA